MRVHTNKTHAHTNKNPCVILYTHMLACTRCVCMHTFQCACEHSPHLSGVGVGGVLLLWLDGLAHLDLDHLLNSGLGFVDLHEPRAGKTEGHVDLGLCAVGVLGLWSMRRITACFSVLSVFLSVWAWVGYLSALNVFRARPRVHTQRTLACPYTQHAKHTIAFLTPVMLYLAMVTGTVGGSSPSYLTMKVRSSSRLKVRRRFAGILCPTYRCTQYTNACAHE